MKLDDYQQEAMLYRKESADEHYALLGLSGEVGELHGLIAKMIRDGVPQGMESSVFKELGDILWFVAAIADDWGFDLEDIARGNLEKLAGRKQRGTIGGSGDDR